MLGSAVAISWENSCATPPSAAVYKQKNRVACARGGAMNSAQVGAVLGYVRQLAAVRRDDDLPDHQLLERFALSRDEAAFAALLKRHGPMVLGVCRSVLHNLH